MLCVCYVCFLFHLFLRSNLLSAKVIGLIWIAQQKDVYNFRIKSVPHEKSANNSLKFHKFESISVSRSVCMCVDQSPNDNTRQDEHSHAICRWNYLFFPVFIHFIYLFKRQYFIGDAAMCKKDCFVSPLVRMNCRNEFIKSKKTRTDKQTNDLFDLTKMPHCINF